MRRYAYLKKPIKCSSKDYIMLCEDKYKRGWIDINNPLPEQPDDLLEEYK